RCPTSSPPGRRSPSSTRRNRMRAMDRFLILLALSFVVANPAFAYDECGNPPEALDLPSNPAPATETFVRELQQYDRDFALDVEGYLVCLQLAESDVNADAAIAPAEKARLVQRFQENAADARGRQTHWRDIFPQWLEAWSRAHGVPVPPPPLD